MMTATNVRPAQTAYDGRLTALSNSYTLRTITICKPTKKSATARWQTNRFVLVCNVCVRRTAAMTTAFPTQMNSPIDEKTMERNMPMAVLFAVESNVEFAGYDVVVLARKAARSAIWLLGVNMS